MEETRSLSQKIWDIRSDDPVHALADLQAVLLQARDLTAHDEIRNFLEPSLSHLENPWAIEGMKSAVERIEKAIENEERIIIFGDFDADGITATVILVRALTVLGANVSYRIPERNRDSHGLKTHLIDDLAKRNVDLIITVDCGINDHKEVAHAADLGIDVIITDHHEPQEKSFPEKAVAIINPKLGNNGGTSTELAGAAVAWKLAAALTEKIKGSDPAAIKEILDPLLEIAAIGIIADCVDLIGENRVLAKFGLEKIKHTQWNGLLQLLEQTGTPLDQITEETVGFVIAPHLNAASRLGDVLVATQLFLGDDRDHASRISQLISWNKYRRELTEESVAQSAEQIREGAPCQVFFHKEWKPGILGLLAARHSQQLGVPVVACTLRDDGNISASCRAPEPYSIIDGLRSIESLLERFGGHAGAAGFLIQAEKLDEFTQQLDAYFSKADIGIIPLTVDAWISPELLNSEFVEFLQFFAPFGKGNPAPVLGLRQVKITNISPMGKQKNHARITGVLDGEEMNFVAFFARHFLEELSVRDTVDIAVTIGENEWNGERRLQLRIEDIRRS